MNEALHILMKLKDTNQSPNNHVITHLNLKNEKPFFLFGSNNEQR